MQKPDRDNVKAIEKACGYACDALEQYAITFISEDANKLTAYKNFKFEYSKI